MVKLISLIFFCTGAFVACSAFIPRLRGNWARTRIPCGFLGSLGIGSAFMGLGAHHFFSGQLPSQWQYRLVWLFFIGLVVGLVGMVLDKRKAKRADMVQDLQTHLITKRGDHSA